MILLTPGPANTTQTVKDALVVPDVCHRESSFAALLASIRRDLLRVACGEGTHDVVLFTGSGTCAVDAAVSSVVPRTGRLLVLANGGYGLRMARIAAVTGIPHDARELPWHEPVRVADVEDALAGGAYTHLACVHHETSTGVLNPLPEIAALCRRHGVRLVLDAISSFAGIPLDLREVPVDVMTVSANKCIQGMPGISFVYASHDVLAELPSIPPRSFYTDLGAEHASARKTGQMRFTPAVQVLFALRQALDELIEETLPGRCARYRANWEALRAGMLAQGFRKLLPDEHESGLLTSYLRPTHPAYDFDRHHDRLLEAGFVIYPAKAGYEHTFRLGNIGQITTEHIAAFLHANAEVLRSMGVAPPLYDAT